MQSNKLSAKDLINVGIYTAMYLVIFFVVGMMNAIPVLYPFLYAIVPIATGIPFMLFLTKTDERYFRAFLVSDGVHVSSYYKLLRDGGTRGSCV